MGKINSRAKGCRHEREVAKLLTELFGVDARRGQQHAGHADAPDVVHGIDGMHVEAKHVERLNLWDAVSQSSRDAKTGGDKIPTVIHRKNKKPNLFTCWLSDLPALIKLLAPYLESKEKEDNSLPDAGNSYDSHGFYSK